VEEQGHSRTSTGKRRIRDEDATLQSNKPLWWAFNTIPIHIRNLETIRPGGLLDDEVVSAYCLTVREELKGFKINDVYVTSVYLWQAFRYANFAERFLRYTSSRNLAKYSSIGPNKTVFDFKRLLIPCILVEYKHWVWALVDMASSTIFIQCSLGMNLKTVVGDPLLKWLERESWDKLKIAGKSPPFEPKACCCASLLTFVCVAALAVDPLKWQVRHSRHSMPMQDNVVDCGMYMLLTLSRTALSESTPWVDVDRATMESRRADLLKVLTRGSYEGRQHDFRLLAFGRNLFLITEHFSATLTSGDDFPTFPLSLLQTFPCVVHDYLTAGQCLPAALVALCTHSSYTRTARRSLRRILATSSGDLQQQLAHVREWLTSKHIWGVFAGPLPPPDPGSLMALGCLHVGTPSRFELHPNHTIIEPALWLWCQGLMSSAFPSFSRYTPMKQRTLLGCSELDRRAVSSLTTSCSCSTPTGPTFGVCLGRRGPRTTQCPRFSIVLAPWTLSNGMIAFCSYVQGVTPYPANRGLVMVCPSAPPCGSTYTVGILGHDPTKTLYTLQNGCGVMCDFVHTVMCD
jgi:hypothetical protein